MDHAFCLNGTDVVPKLPSNSKETVTEQIRQQLAGKEAEVAAGELI